MIEIKVLYVDIVDQDVDFTNGFYEGIFNYVKDKIENGIYQNVTGYKDFYEMRDNGEIVCNMDGNMIYKYRELSDDYFIYVMHKTFKQENKGEL